MQAPGGPAPGAGPLGRAPPQPQRPTSRHSTPPSGIAFEMAESQLRAETLFSVQDKAREAGPLRVSS